MLGSQKQDEDEEPMVMNTAQSLFGGGDGGGQAIEEATRMQQPMNDADSGMVAIMQASSF